MTNKEIGSVLNQIASLLTLQGENQFKIRAYNNAARRVDMLKEPIESLVNEDRLQNGSGLGKSMVAHITEMVREGQSGYYQELLKEVPQGFQEMLKISGLGAKKVRLIYDKLGVDTVGELEYACQENRLLSLEGFGLKTQEKVILGK